MSAIEGEGYRVFREAEENRVVFEGAVRLGGMAEYAPITELLSAAVEAGGTVTVDLRGLEFLNSSGIAMLSKFVIQARNREDVALCVLGAAQVPWQGKSLNNLQRLMPGLDLRIE